MHKSLGLYLTRSRLTKFGFWMVQNHKLNKLDHPSTKPVWFLSPHCSSNLLKNRYLLVQSFEAHRWLACRRIVFVYRRSIPFLWRRPNARENWRPMRLWRLRLKPGIFWKNYSRDQVSLTVLPDSATLDLILQWGSQLRTGLVFGNVF